MTPSEEHVVERMKPKCGTRVGGQGREPGGKWGRDGAREAAATLLTKATDIMLAARVVLQ